MTISKVHTQSFSPGQAGGVFLLTVTNGGGAPTEGRVDVVDDLPVGLIARTASGTGWTCEVSDETVACTRTDALAPGSSYPSITLTADVAPELPLGIHLDQHGHGLGRWRRQPGEQHGRRLRRPVALHATFSRKAHTGFFQTDVGILNTSATSAASVSLRVFPDIAPPMEMQFMLAPLARRTVDLNAAVSGIGQAVSTMIESDQPVAATRQMTWGDPVYGSTLESGIDRTSQTWYFAEGATTVFTVFYLVENPGDTPATVTLTHLFEGGAAPIAHSVVVPPFARGTILVNDVPGLSLAALRDHRHIGRPNRRRAGDVSEHHEPHVGGRHGRPRGDRPEHVVVVRRRGDRVLHAYLLLGNPATSEATVTVNYQLPSGTTITRSYVVPAQSRRTVDVNLEDPQLASTAIAMSITSTLPIVAERAMWWGTFPWSEGSAGIGTMATGHDVGHR